MKNVMLFLLLIGGILACKTTDDVITADDETNDAKVEELVFGIYYGRCAGDCTHFFKLKDDQLFRDAIEGRYDGRDWDVFQETAAERTAFERAESLLDMVPDALLGSTEEKFGSPNVVDQGTLLVVATKDGTQLGPWQIDPITDNLDDNLKDFQIEMKAIIDELTN